MGDGCATCQTEPTRWYAFGQLCHQCPESTPWLFISTTIVVTVLLILVLYKAAQARDDLITDATGANDKVSGAKSVMALASSIFKLSNCNPANLYKTLREFTTAVFTLSRLSNMSIYLRIVLPHWQLLATLIELDLRWPEFVKEVGRYVAQLFSFDFGTAITPECSVTSSDPQTLFLYKFAAMHCAFGAMVALLRAVACVQVKTSDDGSYRRTVNTINAVFTLSMVSLTKSCLKAVVCTYDADLRIDYLDAMPDVECTGSSFKLQRGVGFALLLVYNYIIPLMLFFGLYKAKDQGCIDDPVYRQAHMWLVQKYQARAWFSEFVFIYYRITVASFVVLLSFSASWCLVVIGLATAGMLAFVVVVKPFVDDGSQEPAEALNGANKAQAWALGATLAATVVGFACAQLTNRGKLLNAAIAVLVAFIGVAPYSRRCGRRRQPATAGAHHRSPGGSRHHR